MARKRPPQPTLEVDWFSRLVQFTGYLLIVGIIVFWGITDRISPVAVGAATALLVFDQGRTALRRLGETSRDA